LYGLVVHFVPILTNNGVGLAVAGGVVGLVGLTSMIGPRGPADKSAWRYLRRPGAVFALFYMHRFGENAAIIRQRYTTN
jgi:hypothetical protein